MKVPLHGVQFPVKPDIVTVVDGAAPATVMIANTLLDAAVMEPTVPDWLVIAEYPGHMKNSN
jgi:hypothetical protein